MKKLLLIALIGSIGAAVASNLQTWYRGAWESTVQYKVNPIAGSTTSFTTPVVTYGFGTYVATGASTPVKATTPAANTAAWALLGPQMKVGTAAVGVIAPAGAASITVTYGVTCPTTPNTVILTMQEASVGVPVGYKVKTQSASGFVAEVENLLASGASTAAGTLQYNVTCN